MLKFADYAAIKLLFKNGYSKRAIARLTRHDRETVNNGHQRVSRNSAQRLRWRSARAVQRGIAGHTRLARRTSEDEPAGDLRHALHQRTAQTLSRCTVWLIIGQVARAAGLEQLEIHPHMLRHSCGYVLVNSGTDIRIIQGYLGHRTILSTVRYTALDRRRFAKLF